MRRSTKLIVQIVKRGLFVNRV